MTTENQTSTTTTDTTNETVTTPISVEEEMMMTEDNVTENDTADFQSEAGELKVFTDSLVEQKTSLAEHEKSLKRNEKSLALLQSKMKIKGTLTEDESAEMDILIEEMAEQEVEIDMLKKQVHHAEIQGRAAIIGKWAERRQRDIAEGIAEDISFGYDMEANPVQFARDCSSLAGSDQYSMLSTSRYLRTVQERIYGGGNPQTGNGRHDDPQMHIDNNEEYLLDPSQRADLEEERRLIAQLDFHSARLYALHDLYTQAYQHHNPEAGTYFPKFLNKSMGEVEKYIDDRQAKRLQDQIEARKKMQDTANDFHSSLNRARLAAVS